jgi:hypothetical protein
MGEKGNDLDQGLAAVAASAVEPSLIERVTTTTTQTIVGAGEDVVAKIKDKAIDHGADAVLDEARSRLRPGDGSDPESPATASTDGPTVAGPTADGPTADGTTADDDGATPTR